MLIHAMFYAGINISGINTEVMPEGRNLTKAMEVEARRMRRDMASMEKEVAAMLVDKKKWQLVFMFFLVLVGHFGQKIKCVWDMILILYKNEILLNLDLYMFFFTFYYTTYIK